MTFFKLILTIEYKSMIVNLSATICIANDVSETNVIRKRHACKKFLLALVHSTVVDTIFYASSTILVMVPVDAGFLGRFEPISSIRSTLALHLTFRFKLLMNIDELVLGVAYLTYLLIYQW